MRLSPFLLIATAVTGCAPAPPSGPPDMRGQMMLAQMLQGRAAGAPQRCLQPSQTRNLVPVDASTIAYRDGATTWVSHVQGRCEGLLTGTLVTRQTGYPGTCAGDVAHVVDFSGMDTGSCIFGPFVPYR